MKLNTIDKNKTIRIIAAAIIGVLIIVMLFWQSKAVYTDSNYYYPTETFVQLESGKPVSQELPAPGSNPVLKSVAVTFATNARVNEGDVTVELLSGGEVITSWNIKASELLDNAIREFEARDGIRLNSDSTYTVRITETFEGEENNIAVGSASTGNLSCYIKTYDSGKCLKWFAVMTVVFILGYVLLIVKGGLLEKSLLNMIVIGLVSVLIIFIFEFDLFPRITTRLHSAPIPSSTDVWDTINPGEAKEYTFSYYGDKFEELEIFTSGDNASDYSVSLTNTTTGKTYFEDCPVSPDWRVSTGRLCMMLSTKYSPLGERYFDLGDYTVRIVNLSGEQALNVEIASPVEEGATPVITFAGIRHSDLGIKIASFAIAMFFLYVVALNILRKYNKLSVEVFFLVTVIPLSVMYLIFFQPWNVPDAGAHFPAAYRISNLLMGINGRLEWFGRSCDAPFYNSINWWSERKPDLEGISYMLHGLREKAGDRSLVDFLPHEDKMKYYSFINWFPQAVGMSLARLAGFNSSMMILIGRLFILAVFIFAGHRAIQNTPVGKSVFAGLALLPVSLMMSSSFSYDAMVIITSLSFAAIILKLRYEYSRGALIEAVIWAVFLGAVKGGSLLLLLPLALLLIKKDKKSVISVCSIIGAALLTVLLFDKILPSDELFQFGEENSGNMMTAFAYQQPADYLRMLVSTFQWFGDTYMFQALGKELSYLEATLSEVTVIGAFLAILVYATLEKDKLELKKSDRIIFVVIALLSFILTPAMLLSYTPNGSGMIYGVQGRYLFPMMSLLILAVTKFGLKKTRENASDEVKTQVMDSCINVYVILTLIMMYMMMKLYLGR